MYSSRGSNPYGQQSYAGQQPYVQNSGPVYSGSSIGGPDGGSQLSVPSRHASMLGGSQEADIGGYRAAAQYGGQYGSVYGSSTLSSSQQIAAMNGKGAGSSALQGRTAYASTVAESPKFASGDYVSSSHGYGQKDDQFPGKISDYSSIDRRNYGEPQSAYIGRDLQSEQVRRYADSVGVAHQHQPELYDHIDQVSLLRQQQMLKSQSLQSASLDGSARPADYLAARGAPIRHATQDLTAYGGRVDADPRNTAYGGRVDADPRNTAYGGRVDADPRNLSTMTGSSYGGHQASILGAAPRRNVDELVYSQGAATGGYGVSLPPGRDYVTGKGLRGAALESDYQSSLLSRSTHPGVGGTRIDERKEDRVGFRREHEITEEERRREHVREREREREREKERERERERTHERERLLERRAKEREREREREKERERERKRALEIKRERTPPRISKDHHGTSSMREERSLQRYSPRQEALHRRHSPVREKRREYICKVYPSCLVEVERDYQSLSKRYPRLSISPEFSKVVVNWPKGNLKLSFHTPVSFEHGHVEVVESKAKQKSPYSEPLADESRNSQYGSTVWNAKVILMSGISQGTLEDLSSDKSFDDRIPHINNILRFAFLRKDRSFMAIGGPWDVADGGDPSVDDSSLVQTALRYAKDLTQLELHTCQHWNRFLEIHYERVGKDGLFSHTEVTVLFIPDLSECLPSLDTWREQWFAHKKATVERQRLLSMQKEKKSSEQEEAVKGDQIHRKSDKHPDSKRQVKEEEDTLVKQGKQEKKEPLGSLSEQPVANEKAGNEEIKEDVADKPKSKDEGNKLGDQIGAKENDSVTQVSGVQKPGKKRIIKKVVKHKVVNNKPGGEDSINKENEKLDEKDAGEKQGKPETSVQQEGSSGDPASVKTFVRKRIVKKVPAKKQAKCSDVDETAGKTGKDQEEQQQDKGDLNSTSVQEASTKVSAKKKIIKRVPKKKALDKGATANSTKDGGSDENKLAQKGCDTEQKNEELANSEKPVEYCGTKMDEKQVDGAKGKGNKDSIHDNKRERIKDEKEKKGKDEKDESKQKSSKDVREKGKPEEPPKHPGLILQTEWSKESKLRSMSLSLDSLLDYSDKDIEESTFELSLFAESLNEMLQFQMGSCLLAFLQKLRLNFVSKRNQRKRQQDENPSKESDKENPLRKRSKTMDEAPMENESVKSEKQDASSTDHQRTTSTDTPANGADDSKIDDDAKDSKMDDNAKDSEMDDEMDDYDPEEDADEDQEINDINHQNDTSKEAGDENGVAEAEVNTEKEATDEKDENKEHVEGDKIEAAVADTKEYLKVEEGKDFTAEVDKKAAKPAKEQKLSVDMELLQAFRFFDRNQVGYIKVEDLRLVLHNLGTFLSHRDVKELVQSALLESNTGRDNRILYTKLVKMSDI